MIHLSRILKDRIQYEAAHAYPRECCGLLIGTKDGDELTVNEVVPTTNLAETPEQRFEVDSRARLKLQKILRGTPRMVLGHYHSHPDGPPAPSERDKEALLEPDMIWVVASVNQGGVGDIGVFRFDEGAGVFAPADAGE